MRALTSALVLAAMAWGIAACKPVSAPSATSAPSAAAAPAPAPTPPPGSPPAPVPGWVVFETLPDATIYVDPSSIRREGDRAEMWVLIDYRSPQADKTGKQVLSDKLRYQYECKVRQLSITVTSAHAGPMGGGETINVNPDPPQLTPVPPGTTAERMWARACGDAAAT